MRHLQQVLSAARVEPSLVELLKAGSALAPHDVGTWGAESRNCELVRAGAKHGRRECRLRPSLCKTGWCVMFGMELDGVWLQPSSRCSRLRSAKHILRRPCLFNLAECT